MTPAATQLLEREGELAQVDSLLDGATSEHGTVLVVEGEAGIGKSSLLTAAAERAAERGFRVLSARGGALERDFAYGVARQLFEATVRDGDRATLLDGAAKLAAPALGIEDAREAGDATLAARHGLYWLTDNVAADHPLLLCVDDAQWADLSSLEWLLYLARRLEGMVAGAVIGWRLGEPGAPLDILDSLRAEPLAHTLTLHALSEDAAVKLVRGVLGEGVELRFCRACHEMSGGNPFLLTELAHAVAGGQLAATPEAAQRVGELGPTAISRSVLVRLSRLPAEATSLAQAVAVLDTDARLDVAADVAGLSEHDATQAAVALQESRILASGLTLRFAHPLLRSAVYSELADLRRSTLHRRAADRLHDEPAAAQRAAAHLVATAPAGDRSVVERLREGAGHALERGAAVTAITLLERAQREPPPAEMRGSILLDLGRSELAAGLPTSVEHLSSAFDLCSDLDERVKAAYALAPAHVARGDPGSAVAALERLSASLPADDDERRLKVEMELVSAALNAVADIPGLPERIDMLRNAPGATPYDEHVILAFRATYAFHRSRGTAAATREMAWRSLEGGHLLTKADVAPYPVIYATAPLLTGDEDRSVLPLLDDAVNRSREARDALATLVAVANRARGRWLWGDLAAAEADARESSHLAILSGHVALIFWVVSLRTAVLTDRGGLGEADTLLDAHGFATRVPPRMGVVAQFLASRSRLRLAQRRFPDACGDADELIDWFESAGFPVPAFFGIRLVKAQAALAEGRRDEAAELAEAELAHARNWGLDSAIGCALRTQALVQGGDTGVDLLRESVAVLEGTPRKLELARSLVELGSALRRAGERIAAREPLRQGMELARRCGAQPIVEACVVELQAAGARPRTVAMSGVEALTPSELRVAELAASGLSNREIAQALYVTRKTVEKHMGRVFDKLGVRSRQQIAPALINPVESPTAAPDEPRRPFDDRVEEGPVATLLAAALADVERHMGELGEDRWRVLSERYDAMAREQLARHGGREVATIHHGFLAAFESATRAVRCALAIRDGTKSLGLQVRYGLHAGELDYEDGEVRGRTVSYTTRLVEVAFPDEVVCSHTVHALASGVQFGARGSVGSDGPDGEWQLYAATVELSAPTGE